MGVARYATQVGCRPGGEGLVPVNVQQGALMEKAQSGKGASMT
jgi:hypothetical protein